MDRNKIRTLVIDVISTYFDVDDKSIDERTAFVENLNADSLDMAELVMSLESALNITIDDSQIEKFKKVKDVIDYVVTLNPDTKDYMKTKIQLKMVKRKPDSQILSMFKKSHKKLASKMKKR